MSNAIVALHGWNSSTRGWNESAWNSEVALPGATGAINSATITGFANVSVTGVVGTSAISDVFTTNVGVSATSALGDVFTTNMAVTSTGSVGAATITGFANVSVTGVSATGVLSDVFTTNMGFSATSGLGNLFTTNMGFGATASVNSATVDSSGEANIEVTGVFATGLVSSVTDFPIVWGQIIPSQTPNFSAISPSQNPSWTDIAA
tara:strand:- start:826 stop:1443 length:618 start_codon:yes stop_codon:yes gene_type:complete